jgi:hypothetical protein
MRLLTAPAGENNTEELVAVSDRRYDSRSSVVNPKDFLGGLGGL